MNSYQRHPCQIHQTEKTKPQRNFEGEDDSWDLEIQSCPIQTIFLNQSYRNPSQDQVVVENGELDFDFEQHSSFDDDL